jgi:VCBS repeat-containing protein
VQNTAAGNITNLLVDDLKLSGDVTPTVTQVAGNTASESFIINVVDAAPIAPPLSGSVGEDGPSFSQNLLAGASDPDPGTLLTVQGLDAAMTTLDGRTLSIGTDYTLSGSTLALTATGFAKFDSLGATATDQAVFHYGVSDGVLVTSDSLSLTIVGANDNPIAVADSNGVAKGSMVSVGASTGVLANDTDPDAHDQLVVSAVNGSAADVGQAVKGTYGSLTLNADGSYAYTANKGALPSQIVAQDSFNFTVSDGHGGPMPPHLVLSRSTQA